MSRTRRSVEDYNLERARPGFIFLLLTSAAAFTAVMFYLASPKRQPPVNHEMGKKGETRYETHSSVPEQSVLQPFPIKAVKTDFASGNSLSPEVQQIIQSSEDYGKRSARIRG